MYMEAAPIPSSDALPPKDRNAQRRQSDCFAMCIAVELKNHRSIEKTDKCFSLDLKAGFAEHLALQCVFQRLSDQAVMCFGCYGTNIWPSGIMGKCVFTIC